MTITDEILIAANTLANEGNKPTVALVKAKLNQGVSLPILISTLKNWQHQPDFIAVVNKQNTTVQPGLETKENADEHQEIRTIIQQTLTKELRQVKTELAHIKALIEALSEQLSLNNKG